MNQVIAEQGYSALILGIRSDEEEPRTKEPIELQRKKIAERAGRAQNEGQGMAQLRKLEHM